MKLTEKQKLEILCAYLPYGVECITTEDQYPTLLDGVQGNGYCYLGGLDAHLKDLSPILRHPDDMTENEIMEVCKITNYNYLNRERDMVLLYLQGSRDLFLSKRETVSLYRYLHSIHIDTFGAIESGWAIRKPTEK